MPRCTLRVGTRVDRQALNEAAARYGKFLGWPATVRGRR